MYILVAGRLLLKDRDPSQSSTSLCVHRKQHRRQKVTQTIAGNEASQPVVVIFLCSRGGVTRIDLVVHRYGRALHRLSYLPWCGFDPH